MEFTIHVQVTGLDRLADGLAALAGKSKADAHLVMNPVADSAALPRLPLPPR